MFKLVVTVFAAILAVVFAAPKPGVVAAPLAYSSLVSGPVVSAYSPYSPYSSPLVSAYSAPVVSTYGAAPLAYSAFRPAYLG